MSRERIIFPSHLLPLVAEPGTYAVSGRIAVEGEQDLTLTFHVESVETAEPPKMRKLVRYNIHDHAQATDPEHNPSAYGRHDHPAPPWGPNHRHMNSIRSAPVPPTVVGCTNAHGKVDCFAAGVDSVKFCGKCQAALGRPV